MKKLHVRAKAFCLIPMWRRMEQRSVVLLILLLLGSVPLLAQQMHVSEQAEQSLWALREKYAAKLGVPADSLKHLPLYQMLERWPVFARENQDSMQGHQHGVFAQYIYYLAFNTKIPSALAQTYAHEKTYLFKNTAYLRSGDLLFFGKTAQSPEGVVVYLQNNMVVYPGRGGELVFMPLKEIAQAYELTGAKILKDE